MRIKRETGLLVGVQTPPHRDLRRYDGLREIGVNRVSFCFEIFDRALFAEICPGKDAEYGLDHYLAAIEYCARLGKRGPQHEPWVTNGEIIAGLEPAASSIAAIDWITSVGAVPTVCVFRPLVGTDLAGLEPPESSIAAIDWITSVGAIPTVCVFRPLVGTDLADADPPRTEDLLPVFARLYEACMEAELPIGCAPNVHVSLVMLPEECRSLSSRRYPWQELKLQVMKRVFARQFDRRLRSLARERRAA